MPTPPCFRPGADIITEADAEALFKRAEELKKNPRTGPKPKKIPVRKPKKILAEKSIAHVGAYKRFSDADSSRIVYFWSWYRPTHNDNDLYDEKLDIVNLRYGRDFLMENHKYDWVFVHSVFDLHHPSAVRDRKHPAFVSDIHTAKDWKQRLCNTEASLIVIFEGQAATMSGWQIGQLPGYEIQVRDTKMTVYKKVNNGETGQEIKRTTDSNGP